MEDKDDRKEKELSPKTSFFDFKGSRLSFRRCGSAGKTSRFWFDITYPSYVSAIK
jgi:hypothetical protein